MAETRPSRDSGGDRDNKHKEIQWNIGEHFYVEIIFWKKGWYFTTHVLSGTHAHTHTSRGGTKFCGAWSLYNVWGSLEGKEYKITNTKLVTKVNIYLE